MSADGRSVAERLRDAAVEKPVLGAFVALLVVLSAGFLVALVAALVYLV